MYVCMYVCMYVGRKLRKGKEGKKKINGILATMYSSK